MTSEVAVRDQQSATLAIGAMRLNGLDDLGRVAKAVAASGMFKDANTPEKVAVKMFFAMTMGFSPIAGLTGVDIISGNPTPNAHFWAAAIEDSPLYDYEVTERTNERCTVIFSRWDTRADDWRKRGEITWTIEDAKVAGLAGKDVWRQYPRAMLWARCMTEGGRTYCPGLFGGVRAYGPEELGAMPAVEPPMMGQPTRLVDGLTGEVVEMPSFDQPSGGTVGDPPPAQDGSPEPPVEPETSGYGDRASDPEPVKVITRAQVVRMFAIASEAKIPDEVVKEIVSAVAGVESSKDIPRDKYDAVVDALAQKALDLDATLEEPSAGQAVLAGLKAKDSSSDPDAP